jgi:hypothetical protein
MVLEQKHSSIRAILVSRIELLACLFPPPLSGLTYVNHKKERWSGEECLGSSVLGVTLVVQTSASVRHVGVEARESRKILTYSHIIVLELRYFLSNISLLDRVLSKSPRFSNSTSAATGHFRGIGAFALSWRDRVVDDEGWTVRKEEGEDTRLVS